jgi:transposase
MKVLYLDRSGWCVWAKRLEGGTFLRDWGTVVHQEMDWTALKLILEGIEPKRQYKHYRRVRNWEQSSVVAPAPAVTSSPCP